MRSRNYCLRYGRRSRATTIHGEWGRGPMPISLFLLFSLTILVFYYTFPVEAGARPMRHPCTIPCLAPYDVPAKERTGHVSARRLYSNPGPPMSWMVSRINACTKGKTILDLNTLLTRRLEHPAIPVQRLARSLAQAPMPPARLPVPVVIPKKKRRLLLRPEEHHANHYTRTLCCSLVGPPRDPRSLGSGSN